MSDEICSSCCYLLIQYEEYNNFIRKITCECVKGHAFKFKTPITECEDYVEGLYTVKTISERDNE